MWMTPREYRKHQQWLNERDEVCKTYDLDKFKAFYEKWCKKGIYNPVHLPSDEVIEVAMRKMVYHMASSTEEEKEEAKKWLIAHGSSERL